MSFLARKLTGTALRGALRTLPTLEMERFAKWLTAESC